MALWTSEFLTRSLNEGEIEISRKIKCIFFRYSFAITADTSIYTLPTGLTNILSITWLGIKLEPFNPNLHSLQVFPHSDATSSKPQFYLTHPYNYNKIRFYPIPDTSYSQVSDANLIKGTGIESGVCMSGFRLSDNSSYRVPPWLRTQLSTYYQSYRKYAVAGKGQSLQASEYYKKLFYSYLEQLDTIIRRIPGSVEHRFGEVRGSWEGKPPRPVLPSNFVVY